MIRNCLLALTLVVAQTRGALSDDFTYNSERASKHALELVEKTLEYAQSSDPLKRTYACGLLGAIPFNVWGGGHAEEDYGDPIKQAKIRSFQDAGTEVDQLAFSYCGAREEKGIPPATASPTFIQRLTVVRDNLKVLSTLPAAPTPARWWDLGTHRHDEYQHGVELEKVLKAAHGRRLSPSDRDHAFTKACFLVGHLAASMTMSSSLGFKPGSTCSVENTKVRNAYVNIVHHFCAPAGYELGDSNKIQFEYPGIESAQVSQPLLDAVADANSRYMAQIQRCPKADN